MGHAVGVRADQHRGPDRPRPAEHRPETIEFGLQAEFGQLGGEPAAGCQIGVGQGRTMDARAILADMPERLEIGQQAFAVDGHHGLRPAWH
ncbi:MAG: hypothetical protein ACOCYE_08550 [Pseudomonadota bacterium]